MKKWVLIGIAAIVGIVLYWRSRPQVDYQEYTVEARDVTEFLELSGKVQAEQSATLRFGAGGLITYLGAKEGDRVKKWQTLASVDTRQVQKVLEQKLNLYAIQRGTFEQTVDDNDNSVPDGDLARTLQRILAKNQYQLDNAVLDVEYQDLALKLSRLSSPLEGILVHSPTAVPSVQVTASDTWVVVDPASLQFVADLDETDLARVKVGQKVTVTLDAFADQEFESVVKSISFMPKETTTGTTYEVTIQFPPDALSSLRLGLNGTASVVVNEKSAVPTLPSEAVAIEAEGYLVYQKDGNKYLQQTVVPGVENDGYLELLEGVSTGDTVYAKKID